MSMTSLDPVVVHIIEEYSSMISPGFTYLVVETITGAILVPLLLAIFYFSTASQRRSPIFFFVTLGVIVGIAQAAHADYLLIHSLRHPFAPVALSGIITTMFLTSLATYIIDIALLFRVVAVYPPNSVSRLKFALIIALPVLLKVLRMVEWIVWTVDAVHRGSTPTETAYTESSLQRGFALARLAMTVLDNSYITFVFLWKLRSSISFQKQGSVLEKSATSTVRGRIQALFWFSVSNFVFPVPMLVAQLVLLAMYDGKETFSYTIINPLVGFVCVVCAVFATVWRGVDHSVPEDSAISTPLRFRAPETTSDPRVFKSAKTNGISQRYYHGELELGGFTFGTLRPSTHSDTHSDEGSTMRDSDRHSTRNTSRPTSGA